MKLYRLLAIVCSLTAIAPAIEQAARDATFEGLQQAVIANENNLIAARRKDDEAFFKSTLSADFALVGVDGKLVTGEEAAGEVGNSSLLEFTPYDMKVVALGNDGAILTYDAVVREAEQEDQGPQPRYQHFSSIWIRQNGQWKLKFQQATPAHWGDW